MCKSAYPLEISYSAARSAAIYWQNILPESKVHQNTNNHANYVICVYINLLDYEV